jgi:hypothetical protein
MGEINQIPVEDNAINDVWPSFYAADQLRVSRLPQDWKLFPKLLI